MGPTPFSLVFFRIFTESPCRNWGLGVNITRHFLEEKYFTLCFSMIGGKSSTVQYLDTLGQGGIKVNCYKAELEYTAAQSI